MFRYVFTSLRNYKRKNLKDDLISGIIVTSLSVPVSMGYAQVAGLPPIYGLYASLLPLLIYAAFSSSKQIIFGIGAASSAITASVLSIVGSTGMHDALQYVPALSILTGLFLFLFAILRIGKLISFIPTSVISGFIFGIGMSIMISQIPKILGISSDKSGIISQVTSIFNNLNSINFFSTTIGVISIVVILLGKRWLPKVPFPLFMIIIFTVISATTNFEEFGVTIIGEIEKGLPSLYLPNIFQLQNWGLLVVGGLATAFVITADSLLTSMSFSKISGQKIDETREMFAFSFSNVASAITGGAPVSASMSRTAANVQFRGKTQLVSIVSAFIVLFILLFFSDTLYYMPQPILSSIVFAALFGVVKDEIVEFKELFQKSKAEGFVWIVAMLGVLIIGVLFGIIVGTTLTIIVVVISKEIMTPSTFLGKKEKNGEWYDIKRNPDAKEISGLIVYRFTGSLYFLNVRNFTSEINNHLKDDTKAVIIDAHAMSTIDVTSAKVLAEYLASLKERNIKFYFVNTIGDFRDVIKKRGINNIINKETMFKSIDGVIKHLEDLEE